jgi:lincosamide nucleotidyltransferase A/C/D/E
MEAGEWTPFFRATYTGASRDVDVVLAVGQRDSALNALGPSFSELPATLGLPARYVVSDPAGKLVDLHLVAFDAVGNGWQELPAEEPRTSGWGLYPARDLQARGRINGVVVPCISADLQLHHDLGYAWDEHDRHDMRLLTEAVGLRLPPQLL